MKAKKVFTPETRERIVQFITELISQGAAAAGFLAQRGCGSRAWLFGGAAGLIYAMLAYAVFSILSGSFALNMAMLSDMGIGLLSGMLCAMVTRAAAH